MGSRSITLVEAASLIEARLSEESNSSVVINGLNTLEKANHQQVSFLANPRFAKYLHETKAAAVIIDPKTATHCPVPALIMDNPYLGYAKLSQYFARKAAQPHIHQSAVIADDAVIADSVTIGPNVVIGSETVIAESVEIKANSVIGQHCAIGNGSVIEANVSIYDGVKIGERALIHSAAVIGSDGFGFAPDESGTWNKIAQLGSVIIGDDVEVGAGTTIDRGALEDTIIGNGVKLDNQIQIAHNVTVGDHSAFAGCVGVAGSSRIGQRCTLAGGVVVAGHLDMADDVHITAMGLVTKSIDTPGVYSSGTGMQENKLWKRNVVRFRQLDQLASRLSIIEKKVAKQANKDDSE